MTIPDPTAYDFCHHAKVMGDPPVERVRCALEVPLGARRSPTTHLWRYNREPWPVCEGCSKRESSVG